MKKRTIWTIAVIMTVSIVALILAQVYYFNEVVEMRKKQFDENVKRALYQVAHNMELKEVQKTLEADIMADSTESTLQIKEEREADSLRKMQQEGESGAFFSRHRSPIRLGNNDEDNFNLSEKVRARFLHQKHLLNEVIYANLYHPDDTPLEKRIDRNVLDNALKNELQHNGIDLHKVHYHFKVVSMDGRDIMRCQDYEEGARDAVYRQELFADSSPVNMGFLIVRFPEAGSYFISTAKFIFPALIFSLVVLGVFIYTIYCIFRQKKLSKMKTDFINNMTHELKTPIASISLVSQMLSDPSMSLSQEKIEAYHGILVDETKRLRLLVEKVLQLSMFDQVDAANFKFVELDANAVVGDVSSTFRLKVQNAGGTFDVHLNAEDPMIMADMMHFTNLVSNLLENALKYRQPDVPLHITVSTFNRDHQLYITFADNGLGIRKDDLKRIFERFYRVHTGNVHNVKGVGIGLAYVAGVVKAHNGAITVDSVFGKGTTFTVSFPLLEE